MSIISNTLEYVRRFEAAFGHTVAGVIEAAKILLEARTRLNYGEWESLFADHLIAISKSSATRLLSVARNRVLVDESNLVHLPYRVTVLYELSRVPIDVLQKAIADERVFPEMRQKDVKQLLDKKPGEKPFNAARRLVKIRRYLKKEMTAWPASSKDIFKEGVIEIVADLCKEARR